MDQQKIKKEQIATAQPFSLFVIAIHFLLVILVWFSPILFRWPVILIGIGLFYLQDRLLGECFLTRIQFRAKHTGVSFYQYMLTSLGFKTNQQVVNFLTFRVLPWILLFIALVFQGILDLRPIIV